MIQTKLKLMKCLLKANYNPNDKSVDKIENVLNSRRTYHTRILNLSDLGPDRDYCWWLGFDNLKGN